VQHEQRGSLQEFAALVSTQLAATADAGALPPLDDLAALVEVMFFASLHEEEARRVELSVTWEENAYDCAAVLALTAPVRVTPKGLAKLAPAATAAIAVRREGAELVAWALLERSASRNEHQPLTISAIASGVLQVELAGVPRALYARGEMLLAAGVRSPAERLAGVFPAWGASEIDGRARVVTRIAARALAHGHGGMILVIPADIATPRGVRVHYGVGQGADLLVGEVRDEAIDLVARLTAVDNALLLDTDLRVRGFGVQVIEGDTPEMTFAHTNPYTGEAHVDDMSTFKGTRHPAGVIFCMRQVTEAAAIIASQDSRLSLASKDPRGVVEVLGSYERGFGWR
jgi:hypothetical protein